MGKLKKRLRSMMMAAMLLSAVFAFTAYADDDYDDYDPKPTQIRVADKTKTVTVGKEFKVKVRMSPRGAEENYLKWTIVKGKNVVRFDDDDRTDDEVELRAIKKGTAKLRCQIRGTKKKVFVTVRVKGKTSSSSGSVAAAGRTSRTVEVGDDFELKVRRSGGLRERDLRWSIQNSDIVSFDDYDITDDEVEFKARRVGTTTVTCRNRNNNKSVSFTIRVIPEYDDDYDDDYDDYYDDYDD